MLQILNKQPLIINSNSIKVGSRSLSPSNRLYQNATISRSLKLGNSGSDKILKIFDSEKQQKFLQLSQEIKNKDFQQQNNLDIFSNANFKRNSDHQINQKQNTTLLQFRNNNNSFNQLQNQSQSIYNKPSKQNQNLPQQINYTSISKLNNNHTTTSINNKNNFKNNLITQNNSKNNIQYNVSTYKINNNNNKNNNDIIREIIDNQNVLLNSQQMTNNIYKLNQLNLLKKYNPNGIHFPKNDRVKFVISDYHSRTTNNGYSRNIVGGYFFTR
ncbi:hypothetical protein PPERSA_12374 [Pseudocohnilembus persalinus]|uniref:Uncharacterized protein n=1 Tax=Pseudocohnilembus persalinus TaxID=266149 RepID=A0A0V0QFW2_PSEPJ|nr:hypothetical protein PPERSA_12374 [Pseudocohnilembus persalinus]|eukprot:KRX01094.1 hypothetical protein PPERSA_12374 [Pseudocohnilembus persalinus]